MAPLQGQTLGQRHEYYNKLVEEEAAKKPADLPKINYDETDVDNMIKIDIACNSRNIDYLLEVLKCDDMLYISRAIKKSAWLVTEKRYAHIINPSYLHRELFLHMSARAVSKLLLHIRRYLKDETRVKAFYWYIYKRNSKQALRWLQYCSTEFVESRIPNQANDICPKLMLRLARKSFKVLKLWLEHNMNCYYYDNLHGTAKYWMKTHTEEYLDLIVRKRGYFTLGVQDNFNKKWTYFLMKNCYQRIVDKYSWYDGLIDSNTVINFIKQENIKSFCIKIAKIHGTWSFNSLSPFLYRMPRGEVLDLLESLLAIKNGTWVEPDEAKDNPEQLDNDNESHKAPVNSDPADNESHKAPVNSDPADNESHKAPVNSDDKERGDVEELFYKLEGENNSTFSNVYRWYQFVPFEVAFPDIKKFIFAESDPEERHALLIVLLTCAKYDFEHVKTVVKYYHDKHINEPYFRKIKFVESFIMGYYTFDLDDSTWEILNNLFKSLELYIESSNKLQECVIAVIARSVLHDQPVDKVVEEKFIFETLKLYKTGLNEEQQGKLFNYLYNFLVTKLKNQTTDSETGLHEAIELLKNLWNLIRDWKREETHRQFVIDKVAELGEINRTSKWNETIKKRRLYRRKLKTKRRFDEWSQVKIIEPFINIPAIYNMVKPYRKTLFENSLVLHACEDVCLNALKHDPGLLVRYKTELEDLRVDNRICLNRFLRKLRIYWPDSLAKQWAETSIEKVSNNSGHKALVRGLLVVLSHKKVLEFIKMYAPNEKKIDWKNDENNTTQLNIQKLIAKNMHLVRPQLPIEVVMWYAIGDYLQYSLRSLLAAYATLRSKDIRQYIEILLDSPVSIQKHGIRLAFAKFKTDELINKSEKLWNSTKNSSIRTVLFTSIMDLLCKEKKELYIKKIWAVLSFYIDDLNKEENNIIYDAIGSKVREIPNSVIGEYFPKAYLFLQSLPSNDSLEHVLKRMFEYAADIVEYLDCDFVEKSLIVVGSITNMEYKLAAKNDSYLNLLTNYLLNSKDLSIQMRKYNNVLQPLVEICVSYWKTGIAKLQEGLTYLLHYICRAIPSFVFGKKMVMPLELLSNIGTPLIEKLNPYIEEFYALIARWKLTLAYLKLIDTMHSEDPDVSWDTVRSKSTEVLARICLQHLTDDVNLFFPSIYLLFRFAMQNLFRDFSIEDYDMLNALDNMLSGSYNDAVYLHVLDMIPGSGSQNNPHKVDVILSKIYCHPSQEIKFHYVQKFSTKYKQVILENKENASYNTAKVEKEKPIW